MRIIAGFARGTKLLTTDDYQTRPILDRLKEALFAILASEVSEARVLDLYAGCGTIGLEALSRGAAHCTFVELRADCGALLERNLEKIRARNRAWVLVADAAAALRRLPQDAVPFDLVFADPPFAMMADETPRRLLVEVLAAASQRTKPGGTLILRHRQRDISLPVLGLEVKQARAYGRHAFTFYRRVEKEPAFGKGAVPPPVES